MALQLSEEDAIRQFVTHMVVITFLLVRFCGLVWKPVVVLVYLILIQLTTRVIVVIMTCLTLTVLNLDLLEKIAIKCVLCNHSHQLLTLFLIFSRLLTIQYVTLIAKCCHAMFPSKSSRPF